ncbi:MAG TPA: hypothetical protein DEP53_02025 [Bacteroidetes bacterium]|nr:hypothetical protein [Bacteroidota bacterium]
MNISLGAPELLLLFFALFPAIALFDIWRSNAKDSFEKIVWTCVVLFFNVVGVIVYISVGRKDKFVYDVIRKFKSAT